MSKIQTLHLEADRSCLYATQSVVLREIALNSVALMGVAGETRTDQINVAMQLSKRLANCGLESRILTAHVAARFCRWSACIGLGIGERSTYRISRMAVGFLSYMQ
jgi:hypothetical protein